MTRLLFAVSLCVNQAFALGFQDLSEIPALERRLDSNRERIANQRQLIQQEKAELAESERLLETIIAMPKAKAAAPQMAKATPKPPRPPSGIHIPIAAGQEIATPEDARNSPSLKLGPADVRIQGYVGLGATFRSASMGGGPGTSFAGVPSQSTPAGNATEFRTTTQTSRLALRIDVPFKKDRLAGYVETDFSGAVPGNALISSSSYGFRVRHAWVDYRHSKFEVAAGQMFSLLTPARSDVQTWPADVLTTQAVDTNYLAGFVWDRAPGVRFVYRPDKTWTFAASVENPEQQVGNAVRFPAALNAVLSSQYNTGRGELRTPNVAGDTILKMAWNKALHGRNVHVDAGTVFRFFRSYDPADVRSHKSALGVGGNLNVAIDLSKRVRLITQGFISSGGGRYIGGVLPDVIVRANGEISPVKAHSWVTGLEWTKSRRFSIFTYYSGLYGSRNTALDTNRTLVGFGFNGSNVARRVIQEWTGGYAYTLWNGEDAGTLQLSAQYSYLTNSPWWISAPGDNSHAHMIFSLLRYNLP